ncbi:hypothetical protein DICSQDRAFT_153735, partial [Dichomitus squalens LYAD-421 SS1]
FCSPPRRLADGQARRRCPDRPTCDAWPRRRRRGGSCEPSLRLSCSIVCLLAHGSWLQRELVRALVAACPVARRHSRRNLGESVSRLPRAPPQHTRTVRATLRWLTCPRYEHGSRTVLRTLDAARTREACASQVREPGTRHAPLRPRDKPCKGRSD